MNTGKADKIVERTIKKLTVQNKEVIFGAAIGEDCAVIKSDEFILVSSDPITATEHDIGKLAVIVNVNDISGSKPFAILPVFLIPPRYTEIEVKNVVDEFVETAENLRLQIIGGHTEVTDSVNKMIITCTVFGRTQKVIRNRNAQPGDKLILTKSIGIEGSTILAKRADVKAILTKEDKTEIVEMQGELCVLKEGQIAAKHCATALHDITEGGVLGAVWELCKTAEVGVNIDMDAIPIRDVTSKICEKLGLNPYRLISSGSLLIACDKNVGELLKELKYAGIAATIIGELTQNGLVAIKGEEECEIAPPERDEIYKCP